MSRLLSRLWAWGSERGTVSTEFAVVMGIVLATFFALAVFGGRVVQAENDVRSAAHAGALAPERTPPKISDAPIKRLAHLLIGILRPAIVSIRAFTRTPEEIPN